jgi:hypothetical protein
MRRHYYFMVLFAALAPACIGEVTYNAGDGIDAAPAQSDAGPDAASITTYIVSGKTVDYGALDPLPQIALATEGMTPPMQATSDLLGAYVLPGVGAGNAFLLNATGGANHIDTLNPALTVLDKDLLADVMVMSKPFRDRQYATVNVIRAQGGATLVSSLENLDGTPWTAVPLAAVTLVDMNGVAVPGIAGPYFFGANGDVDPALLASVAQGLRGARVAFLNVPQGTWLLKVSVPAVGQTPAQDAAGQVSVTGGATLSRVVYDPAITNQLTFTTDVYPILQKASKGGQDCASCHTAGGTGAVLVLDDGAQLVLDRLKAKLGLVDLASPALSQLLTKPLYEAPPDHPNATWLDATNPFYKKIMVWISQGALI